MKIGPSSVKPHRAVVSEAADWFIEFRAGELDAQARERFIAWLRRSPEHIQAYLEVAGAWAELPASDPHHRIDLASMIARARAEADIVPLPSSATSRASTQTVASGRRRARPSQRRVLVAASVILASVALGILWMGTRGETYTTGIGEQHTIRLADGSIVELNSRSSVRVRIGEHQRLAELHEGQALFHVARDPARPFIVDTGDTQVRAVGTEFDVYKKASGTVVTVVEGRVAVAGRVEEHGAADTLESFRARAKPSILLSAGEQLTVARNTAATPKPVDAEAATAWVQKRLIFEETALSEVADEFNRYNTRPLIIDDAALRQVRISGIYSSTDPTSLINFLRVQPTIHVIETPQDIQIRKR